jgi:hypothetical protein
MAKLIKNTASRLYLEKADNGIILCELTEDDAISSKILYEIHYEDGTMDMYRVTEFLYDVLENLNIPTTDVETNSDLLLIVDKLDPNLPGPDEDADDDNGDEDDED